MNADPIDPVYIDPTPKLSSTRSSSYTMFGLVLLVVPVLGFVYWLRSERGRMLVGRMTGRKDKGQGYGRIPL